MEKIIDEEREAKKFTKKQFDYLLDHGFTEVEIRKVENAKDPAGNYQDCRLINLKKGVWAATIERRVNATQRALKHMTKQQLRNSINRRYRMDHTATPFDFLKAEYQPAEPIKNYKEKTRIIKQKIKLALSDYTFGRKIAIHNARYKPVVRLRSQMPIKSNRSRLN
jgi:hypothetical protein